MCAVKVIADSACDLPREMLERWDIRIVPLKVMLGNEDVTHLYDKPDAFWHAVERTGLRPQTAAPSPESLVQVTRPLIEAGHDVLAISLTSRISGVYQSFQIAAQDFPGRLVAFDSWSLSLGEGLQVFEAAKRAAQGATLQELVAHLTDLRSRVHLTAVLNTLDWAEQGGRIAYLMPIIRRATKLFNVHVLLHVVDGYVRFAGAQRSYGSAVRVLKQSTLHHAPVSHFWVPHTRNAQLAEELTDELALILNIPRGEVLVHEAGAVLGAHVGPRAIGTVVVSTRDT